MAGVLGEMAGFLLGGGGDGLLVPVENSFGTGVWSGEAGFGNVGLSGSRLALGWFATGGCRTLDLLVWLWELGEERAADVYNNEKS